LFLPRNCPVDVTVFGKPDQAIDIVLASETFVLVALVLPHTSGEAVGHADIEVMRAAGHDVDPVAVFSHLGMMAVGALAPQ